MILQRIVEEKKGEIELLKRHTDPKGLRKDAESAPQVRDFIHTIRDGKGIRIIAEIKRASPSKGILREDLDPVETAGIYEREGACAISVLTERRYFKGSPEDLRAVKGRVKVPVLRKDFIIDECQVYESRVIGADALLLIVAILDGPQLRDLITLSDELGMTPLVEVHSEEELERALSAGADIIGINNRDLRDFRVDINTTKELAPKVPEDRVIVSESGIHTHRDILYLMDAGVDAFLVGEALVKERDVGSRLRELMGKA